MAATERPTSGDASYAVPSSMPSTNPPAPPGPFDARPQEWEGTPTVDRHITPHAAFDAMDTAPGVSGADGSDFRPL